MYKLSTSMMCADPFELSKTIGIIDKHTDYYHVDIMDGHFVPNLTLSVDYVRALKKHATKPIDVHLMVTNPIQYVDDLIAIGVNVVSFHLSTAKNSAFRLINKIQNAGLKAGLIVNPAESLDELEYLLSKINRVTLMTVEPGFAGQQMISEVLPKISKLKALKEKHGYHFDIEIDGSTNFNTIETYLECGAEILILGSCLFNYPDISTGYQAIKNHLQTIIPTPKQESYIIGMDIGGTFTRIGIVAENSKTFEVKKFPTDQLVENPTKIIIDYVNEYRDQFHFTAIAIGFPGVVNPSTLEVISVPNQRQLENGSYLQTIKEQLNLPIIIDKDTNLLLTNDIVALGLKHYPSVLGFYLGTGFGNAIKISNQLLRGDNNLAGEIGHYPILNSQDICGCGKVGCVETISSGTKLKNIQLEYYPELSIQELFSVYETSDQLQAFIRDLASVIATEIILLDITTIILGGGVIAMKDFPKAALESLILGHMRNEVAAKALKIYYSIPNDENGIIGAAMLAYEIIEGQ